MFKHGIAVQTKAFKDVAAHAIEDMRRMPKGAKGAASMQDYEQVLKKYHFPFFDRTSITSIDYAKLDAFDAWRKTEMGRTPAQSTLKSHNAALQRVFDLAVSRGWLSRSLVPELPVTQGRTAQLRNHFTHAEVTEIMNAFPAWIAESRKQVTQDIRKLLYYYVQIALNTGMRPGEELDRLTWGDVDDTPKDHVIFKVRKGKTTLYTGTRSVVGHDKCKNVLADLIWFNGLSAPAHLLFTLPDQKATDQLSRSFTALLKRLELYDTAEGPRTLYSLRHTYITFKLQEKFYIFALAKQCGNSIEMIQQFYGHVTADEFAKELVNENSKSSKLIHQHNSEIVDFGE